MKRIHLLTGMAVLLSLASHGRAQVLFSDQFEANSSALYTITQNTDALATFAYNYSVLGIPSAPHSIGGTTLGLRLEANNGDATAAQAAISLSPAGQSFPAVFRLRFDMWMNANGPFPGGGTGSTEFMTAGVGTAGTSVHREAGAADGTWFAVDGEGQSGIDYRVYRGISSQSPTTGYFPAGTTTSPDSRSASDPYYTSKFPGKSAPALQQSTYAQQTGTMQDGAVGFSWHDVEIVRSGNDVSWKIDGYLIASVPAALFDGNNITVGYWDGFASISDNPTLSFGLIDNLMVEVPEPSSGLLCLAGATALALFRRKK